MWTTTDGYILRLPRSGLTKIMSRLQDSGLNTLIGNHLNGNLMHEVVNSIGQLAKNAHHTGSTYHAKSHKKYFIFTSQSNSGIFQLLARPLSVKQNAILFVHFKSKPILPKKTGNENAKKEIVHSNASRPDLHKNTDKLQCEAKEIFYKANPHLQGKAEVWHRFPLEWQLLFPKMVPNRLSNLVGLKSAAQRRRLEGFWRSFQKSCRHQDRNPSAKEVWQQVRLADRLLFIR